MLTCLTKKSKCISIFKKPFYLKIDIFCFTLKRSCPYKILSYILLKITLILSIVAKVVVWTMMCLLFIVGILSAITGVMTFTILVLFLIPNTMTSIIESSKHLKNTMPTLTIYD